MPVWLIYCHFEDNNYKGLIFVIYWHSATTKVCYLTSSKNTSWVCVKVSEGSLEDTSHSDIPQNTKSGSTWDRLMWVNIPALGFHTKSSTTPLCHAAWLAASSRVYGFKSSVQGQNISNVPCPNLDLHMKGRISCVAMTSIRSFQHWKIKKVKSQRGIRDITESCWKLSKCVPVCFGNKTKQTHRDNLSVENDTFEL